MNTKDNARSRRSRESIRNAMLVLLQQQELTELTVAQLCRQAQVNRSTFYAHYEDLWDVMEELEEEMTRSLLDQFHWVENARSAMVDRRSFLIMTRQIQKHAAFYRACFLNPSIHARKLKTGITYVTDRIVLPYAQSRTSSDLIPYYIAFGKAGILEVLQTWLSRNCQESPEDIGNLLYDICCGKLLSAKVP